MGNKTDYGTAKAEAWAKFYKEELQGRPQWEPINTMQIFDYAFAEAFRYGRTVGMEDAKSQAGNARYIEPPMPSIPKIAHVPEAGKEVDRTMIAAMAMQGLLADAVWVQTKIEQIRHEYGNDIDICGDALKREIAEDAVEFTNALIAELEKEEG